MPDIHFLFTQQITIVTVNANKKLRIQKIKIFKTLRHTRSLVSILIP